MECIGKVSRDGTYATPGAGAVKVAHVSDCYLPRLGGIERQVHELAARQQQAGHAVVVVTSAAGTGDDDAGPVPVVRPRSHPGSSPTRMRYEWTPRGSRAVVRGGFDVVHVHASSFSPLGFVTAAKTAAAGVPTAITVHSLWAGATPLFSAADLLAGWGRWAVAWSAVSAAAARPLHQILGTDIPVSIVPNGVDPAQWRVTPAARPPGKVVIASVGRLALRKRPGPLLRMLGEARSRLPSEVLLEAFLVGEGPMRRPLTGYLEAAGMEEWVHLTGAVSHTELRDLYAGVDFYVAPATLESFGIAALEARCAGLPVIAHCDSGVSEFITDGKDGLLCGSDDAMTEAIVRLASGDSPRAEMREFARSIPPPVSWECVLDSTEQLYLRAAEIAGAKGKRRSSSPLQG